MDVTTAAATSSADMNRDPARPAVSTHPFGVSTGQAGHTTATDHSAIRTARAAHQDPGRTQVLSGVAAIGEPTGVCAHVTYDAMARRDRRLGLSVPDLRVCRVRWRQGCATTGRTAAAVIIYSWITGRNASPCHGRRRRRTGSPHDGHRGHPVGHPEPKRGCLPFGWHPRRATGAPHAPLTPGWALRRWEARPSPCRGCRRPTSPRPPRPSSCPRKCTWPRGSGPRSSR